MMMTTIRNGKTLRLFVFMPALLCATIGVAHTACTPKREAASEEIFLKKSTCIFQNLNRTPEQMLIDCAIPKDARDIQNIIDLFVGAQAGNMQAGVNLPKAGPQAGMLVSRDAGAR